MDILHLIDWNLEFLTSSNVRNSSISERFIPNQNKSIFKLKKYYKFFILKKLIQNFISKCKNVVFILKYTWFFHLYYLLF